MHARGIAVLVIGAALALAGCSAGAPQAVPSAAASGPVTEQAWVAALGPDGVATIDAMLAQPGAEGWIDSADVKGTNALTYAAGAGDAEAVEHLLDAGADPLYLETSAGVPRSALHIAAANGHVAVMQVLLDHGVPVDSLDGARGNALLWAGYKGQLEAAQFLLDAGGDPSIIDGTGMNSARRAEKAGHQDVADLLYAAIEAAAPAASASPTP